MIGDLIRHRELLWLLTVREIRIRYARAALGAAWAVFLPLVMMGVFTVMNFEALVADTSAYKDVKYPVFAFCGLLPWIHFATSMTQGTPSVVLAAAMLKKSAFPHAVIPLSKILAACLDLAIGALVLIALLVHHDVGVGLPVVAVVPLFLLQLAFTFGVVLLTSAANVFFRDVNYLVQVGVVMAMFATSVVYPIAVETPWVSTLLHLNPMSAFLDSYRECLLLGQWPASEHIAVAVLGTVVALGVGGLVFLRASPRFPEEM